MIKDKIECAIGHMFPFILERDIIERMRMIGGYFTYNNYDITVAGLHLGRRRCVLVSSKVLRIYNRDDSV